MSDSMESRPEKKKKRKKFKAAVEVIPDSTDRIAPVVAYFPTGFNPDANPPGVQVFKHKTRSNRLDLVVHRPGANVEFVGTTYSGEAAAPQICSYALGVLDKDSRTLKIVPIAANKIIRLEPKVIVNMEANEEPAEDAVPVKRKMADLTSLYGTKKSKNKDKIWRSLNLQQTDPSTREHLDIQEPDADVNMSSQDAKGTQARNIPPYDSSAVAPEKVYLLDEIILRAEWNHLWDILEIMQSGADAKKPTFWQENNYPSFVFNRIHKLREIQDEEEKEKVGCILSFITHLVKFWKQMKGSRHSGPTFHGGGHKTPRILHQRFTRMFVDPVSNIVESDKKELLIGYILVLTLFADRFMTDSTDISRDLEMTRESLKIYYLQLGCKAMVEPQTRRSLMTLPVPLEFRDLRKRRKR